MACPAAGGSCAEVVYSDLGGTTPTDNADPRVWIESLAAASNSHFYSGSHGGIAGSLKFSASLIHLQPSGGAFNELDAFILDCATANCNQPPGLITPGTDHVYIVAENSNVVSACSFADGACQELPNWGGGAGDINTITSGGGNVYLGYGSGMMMKCDESTPDKTCVSFNVYDNSINDMLYVSDPLQ